MRILAAFLIVFLLVGCGPKPKTQAGASTGSSQTPGQKLDAATAEAKSAGSDAAMTAKVKAALANDVGLKTLNIDVDSNGGVVTLRGQVDSVDTKKRAQEAAQSVKGVTWVQNQLSIAPKAAPAPSSS
ncbi:MAG TPA: BON domain-containing protein [Burkholderiales bacterium]|jgi:osmotically-inducible protein OsmY|nr:BON domain-containing protein [Burkholderiales bacterium]